MKFISNRECQLGDHELALAALDTKLIQTNVKYFDAKINLKIKYNSSGEYVLSDLDR